MKTRVLLAAMLAVLLAGCGVKSDLDLPSGAMPDKDRPDPSKPVPPQQPLGQ